MNDYTDWGIARLRMAIIRARIDGKIGPHDAVRLQEIRGNIPLVMACKQAGIEVAG